MILNGESIEISEILIVFDRFLLFLYRLCAGHLSIHRFPIKHVHVCTVFMWNFGEHIVFFINTSILVENTTF